MVRNKTRNYILHLEPENKHIEHLFPKTSTGQNWNETIICHKEDLADKYDLLLNIDSISFEYLNRNTLDNLDISVGVVCTSMEHLIMAVAENLCVNIVFSPSKLAVLENYKMNNKTLCARHLIVKGSRIEEPDIDIESGGEGISVTHRESIIGKIAAYDIKPGEAIDFGKLT